MPPAPIPPQVPKWWQWFIPGVSETYQLAKLRYDAELLAYMNATGTITPGMKKATENYLSYVYVVLGLLMTFIFVDYVVSSCRMQQAIERTLNPPNAESTR